MVNITSWLDNFLQALDSSFGARVWFVGLQGSYARTEAHDGSDIDTVVILDTLTPADLEKYRAMLDTLPHRELVCGFFAGKDELLAWEASDLFQFSHDTKPIRGRLDALLPCLDTAAVRRAAKIGACNIYHACVHNLLHERSTDILKGLYKSAAFVLQATSFLQTGKYTPRHAELLTALLPADRDILDTFLRLKAGAAVDFEEMSTRLFLWSQRLIQK